MRVSWVAASLALLPAALATTAVQAQTAAAPEQPALHALAAQIDIERMRSDITAMVGFGTRHTLSQTDSDTRGIGAARRWAESHFRTISAECGGCLTIALPADTVTGRRVPIVFREIAGPDVSYIGLFDLDGVDTWTFHLSIRPQGATRSFPVRFNRNLVGG